jgi:hypothetical protein
MTKKTKLPRGTPAWFEMVGTLMSEFAAAASLPPELNVSLVEHYTDGDEIGDSLVQGIRFDIVDGRPSFRIGAGRDERADVAVEVIAAVAHELNVLQSDDPACAAAIDQAVVAGNMRVDGDPSQFGEWLDAVHNPIVDRAI